MFMNKQNKRKKMSFERNKKWQNNKRTVREAFSYMYKHSIFNDVTIQTRKDNVSSLCFAAHKLVLAIRSPLFADMLYSSTSGNRNTISLNISTRSLDILLWYIYNNAIEVDDIEELLESYDAAVQYKISGFPENCVEKLLQLSSRLSASNLYSVINIASQSQSNELLTKCIEFIQKDPESILLDGFQSVSEETFWKLLTELDPNAYPKTTLKAVIKWMAGNNFSDRKFFTLIDFARLDADDFLGAVEEYKSFFSEEEIRCIVSNLLLPNSSDLPPWCKYSKDKEHCVKIPLPSPYEEMEAIKKNAVKVRTECGQKFSKMSLFGLHGFQQDLLLKVAIHSPALRLVILELAFGTEYVPVDNLKIELRSNIGPGRRMQAIKHYLLSSTTHYYLLLCNEAILKAGSKFNFYLRIEATGLGNWGHDYPVSNQRYRTASASNGDSIGISTHCNTAIAPMVCLKPYSEWLVLVDPQTGEKSFVISALYLDNAKNIRNYITYMKKLYSKIDIRV